MADYNKLFSSELPPNAVVDKRWWSPEEVAKYDRQFSSELPPVNTIEFIPLSSSELPHTTDAEIEAMKQKEQVGEDFAEYEELR